MLKPMYNWHVKKIEKAESYRDMITGMESVWSYLMFRQGAILDKFFQGKILESSKIYRDTVTEIFDYHFIPQE